MSKVKDLLLKFARESYLLKAEMDIIATISPTPYETIDRIINDIEDRIFPGITICDFGMGDGRWLFSFAKKHNCICFGLEIEEERLLRAKQLYEMNNNMRGIVEFVHTNFLTASMVMNNLDIIIIYLSRKGNDAVAPKIQECKVGAIIIAIGFKLKDLVYQKRYDTMPPAYIYTIS